MNDLQNEKKKRESYDTEPHTSTHRNVNVCLHWTVINAKFIRDSLYMPKLESVKGLSMSYIIKVHSLFIYIYIYAHVVTSTVRRTDSPFGNLSILV